MIINVAGQHMSIGLSLKEYVENKVERIIERYFDHATSANVHFVKNTYKIKCDILVHDGTGRHTLIKSDAECSDVYSAFDLASAKAEKQLRKYKAKLKDRHHKVKASESYEVSKYVIDTLNSYDENVDQDNPVIIAEKKAHIEFLSVSEAVMKMDLENLPALMFKNSKNNRLNIVYYRKDGNISWVDSE